MKEIPLSQGKVAIVDDVDYKSLIQHKWHVTNKGYAARHNPHGTYILLHREVMGILGEDRYTFVDHIDRDPLNNTKSNLRICSHMQNQWNKEKIKPASSKYKGVSWDSKYHKWRVTIAVDGKGKNGGRYDTEEQAAKVYNELAIKFRGEFARLNVI